MTPRLVNSGSSFAKAPSSVTMSVSVVCLSQGALQHTCRTDRGVILRMAEKDHPFIADEFVKVNRTIGSICLEVGSNAAETQSRKCSASSLAKFPSKVVSGALWGVTYGAGRSSAEPMPLIIL